MPETMKNETFTTGKMWKIKKNNLLSTQTNSGKGRTLNARMHTPTTHVLPAHIGRYKPRVIEKHNLIKKNDERTNEKTEYDFRIVMNS